MNKIKVSAKLKGLGIKTPTAHSPNRCAKVSIIEKLKENLEGINVEIINTKETQLIV